MATHHALRSARGIRDALLVGLLCAAAGAGCAPALGAGAAPTPEEIAGLEAEVAREPREVSLRVELGRAYQAAGRAEEARALLAPVVERDPDNAAAVLYLGLAYEQLERFQEARDLYTRYLDVGGSRTLKARLRGRLPLLDRMAARTAVRALLAQEEAVGGVGADPRHVAVFPFRFEGDDAELAALSRALAELLATDLGQTDRITVLERVQMQALLEELELGASGRVDPATAARGGRLLGAGRIIQGSLEGAADQLRLQAQVVTVEQADQLRVVTDQDALQRLFDLEKRLALAIYSALGVELTPSERERVARRPTQNLQALLAYGHGILAEDAGDYARARDHFGAAVELDPGFDEAAERRRSADDTVESLALTPAELGTLGTIEEPAVPLPGLDGIENIVPPVVGRDPGAEVLGNEGVGRLLILEIILRRPR